MNHSEYNAIILNTFKDMITCGVILPGNISDNKNHILGYCNRNNNISFNRFVNIGEEGVSFDFINGCVNLITVNEIISTEISFSGQTITAKNKVRATLYKQDDAAAQYKYGCVLISLHKDRALNYHFIKDVVKNEETGDYTFECDFDSFKSNIEIGDKYIVAKVAFNNKVEHNVFYDTCTPLCIYGNAIRNIASYNISYSSSVYNSSWQMYMMAMVGSAEKPLENCYAAPIIDNIYSENICYENTFEKSNISIVPKDISDVPINSQSKMPVWEHATDKFIRGCKLINNTVRGKIEINNAIEMWVLNNICSSVEITNSQKVRLLELTDKDFE